MCEDGRCVVHQEFLLRPAAELTFDARNPPVVAVERAVVGNHGRGRQLVLRYRWGDVALFRGWPQDVGQEATRLRSYLAAPDGTYALRQRPELFPPLLAVALALLGLLMLLDRATLLVWRRLRGDAQRRVLQIDRLVLGVRVNREEHAVTARTKIARMVVRPDLPPRAALALEDPDASPRRLRMLDTPKARAILEVVLAAAQRA